jgi:hypothetical protein
VKKISKKQREVLLRRKHRRQTVLFWVLPAVAPLALWACGVSEYITTDWRLDHVTFGEVASLILLAVWLWVVVSLKYSLFLLSVRFFKAKLGRSIFMTVLTSFILGVTALFDVGMLLITLVSTSSYRGFTVFISVQYSLPFMLSGLAILFLIYRVLDDIGSTTKIRKMNKERADEKYEDKQI